MPQKVNGGLINIAADKENRERIIREIFDGLFKLNLAAHCHGYPAALVIHGRRPHYTFIRLTLFASDAVRIFLDSSLRLYEH